MALSTLAPSALHTAIGYQCHLSATNHPDAVNDQGRACSIVAIKLMCSGKPLLTVQFADGRRIKGLFFSALEDETGQPWERRKFEQTALKETPQFIVAKWSSAFRADLSSSTTGMDSNHRCKRWLAGTPTPCV